MIDYAAINGAIMIFTRGPAKQLAKKGVRVNAVLIRPASSFALVSRREAWQIAGSPLSM